MYVLTVSSGVLTEVCHYCVVWRADRCMAYVLIVGFGVRRRLVCVLIVFLCLLTIRIIFVLIVLFGSRTRLFFVTVWFSGLIGRNYALIVWCNNRY